MSKFTKALEQAQRERALRSVAAPPPPPPPAAPPAPPSVAAAAPPEAPKPVAAAEPTFAKSTPRQKPSLPRFPATLSDEVDSHLVSLVSPAGLEAEQYRALRHMVEQKHSTDNLSVIAVSSPGVGDGKTTTAINLAGALAQGTDNSVLARRGRPAAPVDRSVARIQRLRDRARRCHPRSHARAGRHRPEPSAVQSECNSGWPDPAEPLRGAQVCLGSARLLDEARERFDYIVMDTPPLVPVQDCRVLARWVDGVVLVVAADHTPRALLEAALDILDPRKVVGLVFNGYDHLLSGRYANSYVGYYAQPAAAARPGMFSRVTSRVGSLLHRAGDAGGRSQDRTR